MDTSTDRNEHRTSINTLFSLAVSNRTNLILVQYPTICPKIPVLSIPEYNIHHFALELLVLLLIISYGPRCLLRGYVPLVFFVWTNNIVAFTCWGVAAGNQVWMSSPTLESKGRRHHDGWTSSTSWRYYRGKWARFTLRARILLRLIPPVFDCMENLHTTSDISSIPSTSRSRSLREDTR